MKILKSKLVEIIKEEIQFYKNESILRKQIRNQIKEISGGAALHSKGFKLAKGKKSTALKSAEATEKSADSAAKDAAKSYTSARAVTKAKSLDVTKAKSTQVKHSKAEPAVTKSNGALGVKIGSTAKYQYTHKGVTRFSPTNTGKVPKGAKWILNPTWTKWDNTNTKLSSDVTNAERAETLAIRDEKSKLTQRNTKDADFEAKQKITKQKKEADLKLQNTPVKIAASKPSGQITGGGGGTAAGQGKAGGAKAGGGETGGGEGEGGEDEE